MIRAVDEAMRELQTAVLARALYPVAHPKIRSREEKAFGLLSGVLSRRKEISLFTIDKRVIFDGEPLPTSEKLSTSLFRMLRDRGVSQLTFREGLGAGELRGFIESLASSAGKGRRSPTGGPHLVLGVIESVAEHSDAPMMVAGEDAVPVPTHTPAALGDVWTEIRTQQCLDAGLLGDIVSSLSHAVLDSAGALLPLAPLKSHDEYTFTHIINVAILTMSLGEALGFDANATHELGIAALLHDVGKLAVPIEVLNKNDRFSDDEFRAMRVHPVEGARILLRTPGVPEVAVIVAYEHHVRYDGGGYPRVPRSWKLNLASRITQLADVFDALRTHRPYRPGMPLERILTIMRGEAGTFFDPDLLEVFLGMVLPRGVPDEPPPPGGGFRGAASSSPATPAS